MQKPIYQTNGIFQQLDLSALKYFHAIATYGGFSKAARATGASQPALSLGLKKLESALGVTLIDRRSRQFTLTREGLTLLGFCQRLENSLDSMVAALGSEVVRRRRLKVGTALSIGVGPLIAGCVRAGQEDHPPEIELTSHNTYTLLSELRAGSFDAALVPDDVYEAGLKLTRIKEDRLVFVVGKNYERSFVKNEWITAAAMIPLVTYPRETPMRALVDRVCLQHQLSFKTIISANNMDAVKAMVAGGAGGAFVLKSIIQREITEGALVETKAPFALAKSGIAIATREGEEGDAVLKVLKKWVQI